MFSTKINTIVFFILALVILNAHGRSGSCSIDPAIGGIAGQCEKLENKHDRDGAVILYLPGTEGVADFATMRILSPTDNATWFLSSLLGTEHSGVSAATSALPRVRYCTERLHKNINNSDDYRKYCQSRNAQANFSLADAQSQAERALDQARQLASDLKQPLVIIGVSHGCNHVAKLVSDGRLREEPLLMISCPGVSMQLNTLLQTVHWTHWSMLRRQGLGRSLHELRNLHSHSVEWRKYIPLGLIEDSASYCSKIGIPESDCNEQRIGEGIFIQMIETLSMFSQSYGTELSSEEYVKLGELFAKYRVGAEEVKHLLWGDSRFVRYTLVTQSWSRPRYSRDMLKQDAAYKSMDAYQGSIRYFKSGRDVLVLNEDPYCLSGAKDCREVFLDTCPHELPDQPGLCATLIQSEIRRVIANTIVNARLGKKNQF